MSRVHEELEDLGVGLALRTHQLKVSFAGFDIPQRRTDAVTGEGDAAQGELAADLRGNAGVEEAPRGRPLGQLERGTEPRLQIRRDGRSVLRGHDEAHVHPEVHGLLRWQLRCRLDEMGRTAYALL